MRTFQILFNVDYFSFKDYASILKQDAEKWDIDSHTELFYTSGGQSFN